MGLFDFLTNSGSSLPQNQQQGLPPQHSTAARILELLGGFTGIMPLAGLGYLADQPTEEAYNEKVWPRIKTMLKDSGVPDQKLNDLEMLPMSARVGPANQLWQASLKQRQQQKQGTPRLFSKPGGGFDWITPGAPIPSGELPYEKPSAQGEPKTLLELLLKQNPNETAQDAANFLNQFKGQGKEQKPTINWRWETTPDGRAIQRPYKFDPASGSEVPVSVQGEPGGIPARLNATEQRQVDAIREVADTLPVIQEAANALPKNISSADFLKEYAKYRAGGLAGVPDPRFTDYFDLFGQIKPTLMAARIGGLSRSKELLQQLSPHIPDPTDVPAVALRKLQDFNRGAFNSTLQAIIGGNARPLAPMPASMSSGGALPPEPSFPVARYFQKGDGSYVVQGTDGKLYNYDAASSQWMPAR